MLDLKHFLKRAVVLQLVQLRKDLNVRCVEGSVVFELLRQRLLETPDGEEAGGAVPGAEEEGVGGVEVREGVGFRVDASAGEEEGDVDNARGGVA